MRNNVIKFDNNIERRIDLAVTRRENGDLIGALLVLKAIISEGNFPVDVYSEIAKVYMDMDMIHYASEYWFKFLNVCPSCDKALAYHGLGTCYYLTDYIRLAGYYYEKQLDKAPDEIFDYTDEMMDCFDIITESEKPSFHICYPEEKCSSETVIDRAEKHLFDEKGDEAISLLETVSEDDENYIGAQLRIVAAKLIHGQQKEAEDALITLVERFSYDKLPLINLVCYYADEGRREDFDTYRQRLEDFSFEDFGECYKLAVAFSKMNDDKEAERFIEKALVNDPWAVSGIYLQGVIKYNLGKFDEAEDAFFKMYVMTGNPIARFYQNLSRETKAGDTPSRLGTETNLPPAALDVWVKRVTAITTGITKVNSENLEGIFEMCDWIYSFPNGMQKELPDTLIRSKNAKVKKYFLDILLYPDISDEVKSRIISAMILANYEGKIGVVFSGIYQKISLIPLKEIALNRKEGIIKRAYAKAFGKLCSVSKHNRRPLYSAALDVRDKLSKNGAIGRLNDVNALAAALILISKSFLSEDKELLAGFMQTEKKKINSVLRIINKHDDDR